MSHDQEEIILRRGLSQLADDAPSSLTQVGAVKGRQSTTRWLPMASAAAAAVLMVAAVPVVLANLGGAGEPEVASGDPTNSKSGSAARTRLVFSDFYLGEAAKPRVERGTLAKDPHTGCVLLNGVVLSLPMGSSVVDESHIKIANLGTYALGEPIELSVRDASVVRSVGGPREQDLADQYLDCMDADQFELKMYEVVT